MENGNESENGNGPHYSVFLSHTNEFEIPLFQHFFESSVPSPRIYPV